MGSPSRLPLYWAVPGKFRTRLGRRPTLFAYPFGSPRDINDRTPDLVRELGLRAAFLANDRANTRLSDPFRLDRMSADLFMSASAGMVLK